MNPISRDEVLFEATQPVPGLPSAGAPAEPASAILSREAPPRFRHIERNQHAWMVVDLERMLDEPHPAPRDRRKRPAQLSITHKSVDSVGDRS